MAPRRFSATFGLVLRKDRLATGLSQEALAADANILRTHIGLFVRGERGTGLDIAERLARILGTSPSVLIAETEQEWRKEAPTARRN